MGSIVEFGDTPWLAFLLGAALVAIAIVIISAKYAPAVTDIAH